MKNILAAMSGGVDSSVAAKLLLDAGYSVTGATMKLFSNEDIILPESTSHTCCALNDVEDARNVCYRLGIEHHTLTFGEDFRDEVMRRFAEGYLRGETPNPCIDCNRFIKFRELLRRAEVLGYDGIATGHYARVRRRSDGRYLLLRGNDRSKDQSYVLYSLTQGQLARILLPIGDMDKTAVRAIAEQNGLVNARKPDSQDICFVPDGDYAAFIEKFTGKSFPDGDFKDSGGNTVGRHHGNIRYTVGQRRGLNLSMGKPVYVLSKDVAANTVTVGTDAELYSESLICRDVNLIPFDSIGTPIRVTAKTRYSQKDAPAILTDIGGGRFRLDFDEPQRAVTSGQAAVFYDEDGETVVGGGTICN